MKSKRIFNNSDKISIRQSLRKRQTFSEKLLWQALRNRQLLNLKFRRQYSIGNYIVDFYCPELHLVIELDGAVHEIFDKEQADKVREQNIQLLGLKILRFKNREVEDNLMKVLETVKKTVYKLSSVNFVPGSDEKK